MDKNNDNKLTYQEFIDGSKQDPAIARVMPSLFRGVFSFPSSDTETSGSSPVRWFCVTHSSDVSRSVRLPHLGLEGLTRQEQRPLCCTLS